MPNIRWECARSCEQDAAVAFAWRNDPDTRSMSFHTELQTWEDYYPRYLTRAFAVPDLPPLFGIHADARVAFIFFEACNHPSHPRRRCCTISINLDPQYRSKGIGGEILKEIQPWLKQRGYDTVLAEIKPQNIASLKAFEKAGFSKVGECEKHLEDQTESIPMAIYGVELTSMQKFPQGVYIIAEAGSNWRLGSYKSDLAMAKALIEAAAESGANGVKFQVFRPETVYVANAGQSDYLSAGGISEDIATIFSDLAMPYEMIPLLAEHCKNQGVDFLASFFSERDFEEVNPYVSVHKIASYEMGHIRLLERAAKSGKPIIISTGASTEDEIAWTVDYAYAQGARELVLLQCTACYPAAPSHLHLAALTWLRSRFHLPVGLSDHSRDPFCAPIAATALGGCVIEKHFTLNRRLPGPDHYFAVTPSEFKEMAAAVRTTYEMVGKQYKEIDPSELELRHYAKRGVQAIQSIKAGECLLEGINAAILRPGKQPIGMPPKMLLKYAGRRFIKSVPAGHGIQPGDLEPVKQVLRK